AHRIPPPRIRQHTGCAKRDRQGRTQLPGLHLVNGVTAHRSSPLPAPDGRIDAGLELEHGINLPNSFHR
ncbi:hypothetical protein ACL02R_22280, partial [Streptomyces sp. MS19]|uniref:hypothetical protein n=1 Tax=Streptomyces sp. MS19 TaxID=3385972 RepID=UPI0039A171B0